MIRLTSIEYVISCLINKIYWNGNNFDLRVCRSEIFNDFQSEIKERKKKQSVKVTGNSIVSVVRHKEKNLVTS